jgi:hypothetical protein
MIDGIGVQPDLEAPELPEEQLALALTQAQELLLDNKPCG